jgi:predicted amidohydrolase
MTPDSDTLRVGIAQIAPVWLDRDATIDKVCTWIEGAARDGCELVAFGEALVPGYPFWLERTDGARFESPLQKALHAHYLDQAVDLERGDLHRVQEAAADHGVHVCVGTIERPADRGGHSVYCTLVQVNAEGRIVVAHRKLMPTYEERLAWATGDGHGLRTTAVGPFTVGALNCWENWMPLPRAALYAQGEDLHVATWPGSVRNTQDITRFIAREEQFRPRAYRDRVGRGQPWTVGYGRTGPDVGPNTTMTEPEALQWVVDRVRRDSVGLARAGVMPSPGLLSFVYNAGLAPITDPKENTGIGRAARAGDWGQVAQELQRWIYGSGSGRPVVQGGLVRRRRGEAQMLPDTTLRALLGGTDQ